jgi:hypothetical protein
MDVTLRRAGNFVHLELWAPLDPAEWAGAEAWRVADIKLMSATRNGWKSAYRRARIAAKKKLAK